METASLPVLVILAIPSTLALGQGDPLPEVDAAQPARAAGDRLGDTAPSPLRHEDPAERSATGGAIHASKSVFAVDETVTLRADILEPPLTWSLRSQPGGWTIRSTSPTTAVVSPQRDAGTAGDLLIGALGGTGRQSLITLQASECDECWCPTIHQFSVTRISRPKVMVAAYDPSLDRTVFELSGGAYEIRVEGSNVGLPGDSDSTSSREDLREKTVGIVQERIAGFVSYQINSRDGSASCRRSRDLVARNDGRLMPGEPCDDAGHCPWYPTSLGIPVTLPPGCGPHDIECGKAPFIVIGLDTPTLALEGPGHLTAVDWLLAFQDFVVSVCDDEMRALSEVLWRHDVRVRYTGGSPAKGGVSEKDYQAVSDTTPQVGRSRPLCEVACPGDVFFDCDCSHGFANYEGQRPLAKFGPSPRCPIHEF